MAGDYWYRYIVKQNKRKITHFKSKALIKAVLNMLKALLKALTSDIAVAFYVMHILSTVKNETLPNMRAPISMSDILLASQHN